MISFWYFKNQSRFAVSFRCTFSFNFVPPSKFLGDTVFKNSYTSRFLFWSVLSTITVFFSWYFMKVSRKWSEEASIFGKLQVYENIHAGFSFSVTLKTNFWNNVLLQISSLLESCFIEIRVLMLVTLQKEFRQVRFMGISRVNTLQKCIQTQSNI